MNLSKEIINGNITALSKGITLIESTLDEHEKQAQQLIADCQSKKVNSIRIGITGVPGVGKSTFIETFGSILTKQGKKVAVLAIDPTSERTQGSILGDKSRMHKLSTDKNAFIRPSPSNCTLGGVTNKTRESIILCEAAGFEVILIETVGVGQSETTVKKLVDFFLVLMLAGAGDELQGIKRGITELADALVITKSDGNNKHKAKDAALKYKRALQLFKPMENGWVPKVTTCSALDNEGIAGILKTINNFNDKMENSGWKKKNRNNQKNHWLHIKVKEELGRKRYNAILKAGNFKRLEKELKKGKTILQLIKEIESFK